eukprot:UN17155
MLKSDLSYFDFLAESVERSNQYSQELILVRKDLRRTWFRSLNTLSQKNRNM